LLKESSVIKKILKWAGIVVGSLIGVIVVIALVLFLLGSSKVGKDYDVQVASIPIPTGADAVERGRHYIETLGLCSECHGDRLEGDILEDDPAFGTLAPPNLTSGAGGIGGTLTDIDYVRSIRHGIGRDGKSLVIMPSHHYNSISDADLGAIIAFLKSLPPITNQVPETKLGPLGKVITLMAGDLLPASVIDHTAARPPEPIPGVTAEYGKYLSNICTVCHGENLSGGSVPGESGDAPVGRNLTPKGALVSWSESDFMNTLRTGVTPAGEQLDEEFMPWPHFKHLTDDELKALWLYVKALPPKDFEE
jgi:mono/diheme cytochrome c family protein